MMPPRLRPYIISLSSIPSRFASLAPVLCSLRDQSIPPARVILYLPQQYRRFPAYGGTLPMVPEGIEIRQVTRDFGPASKILHAVRDFGALDDGQMDILFADDDILYERDWAERLLAGRDLNPDAAICAHGRTIEELGFAPPTAPAEPRAVRQPRWRDFGYRRRKLVQHAALGKLRLERHEKPYKQHFARSGHTDIFEGFAGVLVQPRFFGPEVFDIPDILWAVDDVWLSGMITKRNIPIWLEADATRYRYMPARHADALNRSVIEGANREQANRLCVEHMQRYHGIWI